MTLFLIFFAVVLCAIAQINAFTLHKIAKLAFRSKQGVLFAKQIPITVEFKPSNKIVQAMDGEMIGDVAERAGVLINYKCKKGECGTCQVKIDGKWVKACQTSISPPTATSVLQINTTSKSAAALENGKKKPSAFFSPASFLEGVVNNGLGVIGFVKEAKKVDDAFERRMEREKALAEKVAAAKEKKQMT